MYRHHMEVKFKTGVTEIDQQHSTILDLIEECSRSIKSGQSGKDIGYIISRLSQYAKEHFALEEKYMDKAGYSEIKEHIKEHETFIDIINTYEEQYKEGIAPPISNVMEFLLDWFTEHILISDLRYSNVMKDAGIK